ncbi:DUF2298 domain-containing protein [Halocalculus aciditolerans]|uniref:Chlor_Arch_YYY domain-containing protein n=1 Tax=Halocalculus aciditolerans TaxID=1383812 RepID=A0A830FJJ5_9EURY|nr:DUF2298 domain-containing protein [Halocalculus aciditolerans]GGL61526.1 hypothetical protein GCM10009039_19650 [Halocalculus aciditolerans]
MEFGLVALWWVAFAGLFLLGAPLAARLLPAAVDRGLGVALPLALVVVVLPTYWVGLWAFGRPAVFVGVVVLVALAALAARGGVDLPRRELAETLAVFTLAFCFLLAVRAVDPAADPGAGEKFLDFGILQSLLRANSLPPQDVWFAGERVVYYYGGHLLAATLALLTDTSGRYAYNLALAGVYAAEVTAVFGLARDLAAEREYPARAAGALGAVWFGLASNLYTPVRLLAGVLPSSWVAPIAGWLGVPLSKAGTTPATFSYWPASRAMQRGDMTYITEFPLFSYRNGDLHAHMLAVLVTFLVAAVLYAYYETPEREVRRRRGLLLALAPCVGFVTMVNTWSLPVSLGLVTLTLALAPASPWTLLPARLATVEPRTRLADEAARPLVGVAGAAVVAALALLVVAPFVDNVLLTGVGSRHVSFSPERSPLGGFLLVHGAFLLVFASHLTGTFDPDRRQVAGVVLAGAALVVAGWWLDLVGLFLAGPLVAVGWYALRERGVGFETLLVVAGAGLLVVVEFAYLSDAAAPGRLNTVFKTYFSTWSLWSVAAGVALASLLARTRTWLPVDADRRRSVGIVLVTLVLAVVLAPYAGMALTQHFDGASDPTLDAIEYTHQTHPAEADAIEWVNDREGQPHILERPGRTAYTWRNPASSLTGVPSVVGWVHEAIYRGGDAYQTRANDADIAYTTNDTRTRHVLLEKYDVEYVYVGPLERERYGDVENRFDDDPALTAAYEDDGVTIYAYNATESETTGS